MQKKTSGEFGKGIHALGDIIATPKKRDHDLYIKSDKEVDKGTPTPN